MAAIRDVRFGRIYLPTIYEDIAESVGDTLEAVGGGVTAGERRARSFNIALPVHGSVGELDPYVFGLKARRQLRSLMENARAKLHALYFRFSIDEDLNAWLVVGAGDLTYSDGGITLGSFKLQLSDTYKIGTRRTHRTARRIEMYDRRLSTTARDFLGTIFLTDFASYTPVYVVYLPVGVSDITGRASRVIAATGTRDSLAGDVTVVDSASHAEVLAFEWDEDSIHASDDVVVYDRRGATAAPPVGNASAILASGPVGYWRFGELPGSTTFADSSESNFPGSFVGVPTLGVAGAISDPNTAAGLSYPDAIYGKVPDNTTLRFNADFTAEGWVQPIPGTTNVVPHPSFETEIHPWVASNATVTRTTAQAFVGSASMQITSPGTVANEGAIAAASAVDLIPIKPSTQYTVSVYVRGTAGNRLLLQAQTYTGVGGTALTVFSQTYTVVASNTWERINLTFTSDATANAIQFYIRTGAAPAQAITFYVDAVQMVEGSTAPAFATLRPRYLPIAVKWRSSGSLRGYRCAYDCYFNEMVFELSTSGTARTRASSTGASIMSSVWSHLAFTYDNSGTVTFFRNGVQIGSTSGLPTSINATTVPLSIGTWECDVS